MSRPVPLFILGLQRSGTTFAANLLAAHPQIAAVAHARHRGVHESVFFSHFARLFGDWSETGARAEAVAAFLDSDYFRLTGLDAAATGAAMQAAQTPGAAFRQVMDTLAQQGGRRVWIEKSPHHTLLAAEIADMLPDAHFLCIARETADFTRSRLWAYGRQPPRYPGRARVILRACLSNAFHQRFMAGLPVRIGANRVHAVGYAALARDPDAALAPLLSALGLAPLAGRRPDFAANSSFASAASRAAALGRSDRALIAAGAALAGAVPQPLLAALQRRAARRRPRAFPAWVRTPDISGPAPGQEGSR